VNTFFTLSSPHHWSLRQPGWCSFVHLFVKK
jgi:hypothetical protein